MLLAKTVKATRDGVGRGQQWGVVPSVGRGETHTLSGRPGRNATRVHGAQGQVRGASCKGAWPAQDCHS